jgi:conjugal transfer/entry exclusion protein
MAGNTLADLNNDFEDAQEYPFDVGNIAITDTTKLSRSVQYALTLSNQPVHRFTVRYKGTSQEIMSTKRSLMDTIKTTFNLNTSFALQMMDSDDEWVDIDIDSELLTDGTILRIKM